MPSQGRILTPEQLALSQARKKKKAEAAAAAAAAAIAGAAASSASDQQKSSILSRIFLSKSPSDLNYSPSQPHLSNSEQTSVMSWNMLAQCLVRRELFPTSDCLKAAQRDGMLIEEITRSGAELICLQEVDRLEKLGPALESAGYSFVYSSGPKKKHGCLIVYKKSIYKLAAHKTIFYDDSEVHFPSSEGELDNSNNNEMYKLSHLGRKGSSFRTKNIGLIVALKRVSRSSNINAYTSTENPSRKDFGEEQDVNINSNITNVRADNSTGKRDAAANNSDANDNGGGEPGGDDCEIGGRGERFNKTDSKNNNNNNQIEEEDSDPGVVVATTHLFWHPRYTYERARQSLILLRSVCEFKEENNMSDAPSFIAGDFNFGPSDAAYFLLVGDPLTPEQEASIRTSHVVHHSIDPTVPVSDASASDDDDEAAAAAAGGEVDKDGENEGASGEMQEKGDVAGNESGSRNDSGSTSGAATTTTTTTTGAGTGVIGAGKEPKTGSRLPFKNARPAVPSDGLLSPTELERQFKQLPNLRSAYDEWGSVDPLRTFGARVAVPPGRRGRSEPMYTSYTHYWKTTLDYIFILLPPTRKLEILGVLEPPVESDLGTGLPRKGVCGSDHIAVRAHVAWPLKANS